MRMNAKRYFPLTNNVGVAFLACGLLMSAPAVFAGSGDVDLAWRADAPQPVAVIDLGRSGAGGYPAFEIADFRCGKNGEMPVLRVSYACRASQICEKGDFWKDTAATYLGKDVQLPIFPANPERYETYRIDRCGPFRASLLQGLVRYVRFSLETPGASVCLRGFRLANDRVHSEGERAGSFTCSDNRLTALWEASVRTCELSAIPSYLATNVSPAVWTRPYLSDGAKRDRLVWSGDLWWAARNVFFGFKPEAPYMRGSLEMLADSQTPEGYIQACPWPEQPKPCAEDWGAFPSDEFAAWFVPVLADYVLYSGDRALARRMRPTVSALLRYLGEHCREDGLFEQRRETSKHACELAFGSTSVHHRSYMNILLWKVYRDAADLADWTECPDEAARYRCKAAAMATVIRANFWNAVRGEFRKSLEEPDAFAWEASALALAVRFTNEEEARALSGKFTRNVWGKFQALAIRGLFEYGFDAEAMRMIGEHAWFEVLKPDWTGLALTSECMIADPKEGWMDEAHPDTAMAGILSNYILGIEPIEPGFMKFKVRPHPAGGVTFARGDVPTPHGFIRVAWHLENDAPFVSVVAPHGAERVD